MLILVRYAKSDDECAALEAHTLLKNRGHAFAVYRPASGGDPSEILDCSLAAADLLCAEAIWTKSTSILLNTGTKEDLHFVNDYYVKKHALRSSLVKDFIDALPAEFCFVKKPFLIRSHFYGPRKLTHVEVVTAFSTLLSDIGSGGTDLEIDVAKDFSVSFSYKKSARSRWLKFGVKSLDFIGRTSMNVEDAVFMANMCDIRENMVVYDPCAGSGSLLLVPAVKGAFVIASDIDWWEMVGSLVHNTKCRTKLKGTDVHTNFAKFGVAQMFLGAAQADVDQPFVHSVDRVVADVPYGRRISLGSDTSRVFVNKVLEKAQRVLVKGGIVALWAPVMDAVEFGEMILVTKYVQKTFSFARCLFVYKKA